MCLLPPRPLAPLATGRSLSEQPGCSAAAAAAVSAQGEEEEPASPPSTLGGDAGDSKTPSQQLSTPAVPGTHEEPAVSLLALFFLVNAPAHLHLCFCLAYHAKTSIHFYTVLAAAPSKTSSLDSSQRRAQNAAAQRSLVPVFNAFRPAAIRCVPRV